MILMNVQGITIIFGFLEYVVFCKITRNFTTRNRDFNDEIIKRPVQFSTGHENFTCFILTLSNNSESLGCAPIIYFNISHSKNYKIDRF